MSLGPRSVGWGRSRQRLIETGLSTVVVSMAPLKQFYLLLFSLVPHAILLFILQEKAFGAHFSLPVIHLKKHVTFKFELALSFASQALSLKSPA